MFDYEVIEEALLTLLKAASVYKGWQEDQASTFVRVGEYGLALDSIADAYLANHVAMPPDLFKVFEDLVAAMDLGDDPELQGVAELRMRQITA